MRSSTSSFEPFVWTVQAGSRPAPARAWAAAGLRGLLRERVLWVAGLVLLLGAATVVLRASRGVGLSQDYYWTLKLQWHHCADCVLSGDSRVAYGLSPAGMERVLAGQRICNFAFAAGMYSEAYLDAIEAVLDPAGECPTIVLGITARALLPGDAVRDGNGFARLRQEAAERSALTTLAARWLPFTSAMSVDQVARELNPLAAGEPFEVRFSDGWTAQTPYDEQELQRIRARQLEYYEKLYVDATVDRNIVRRLLERVRRWTARGITVYAWRPPTGGEMRALEDRLSGFDEVDFARRLELAGGTWLAVGPADYRCYDGSHLFRDAAVGLSQDLARRLQRHRLE